VTAPLEILHILGAARPESTGIARIVAGLAAGLDPRRYRLHVWFLGEDGPLRGELETAGARVRVIDWTGGILDVFGACRFFYALRGGAEFAIVHQHFGARAPRGLVRRATRARIIVHLHGYVSESDGPFPVPVPIHGADFVIGTSRMVAELTGHVKNRAVYPGVAVPADAPIARNRNGKTLGTACRLVAIKGLVHLIRALAVLREEFPGLRLEIAGSGTERGILEEEARSLGLAGRVDFLGWRQDIARVMGRWDVFVMPSLAEGLGIAALEAMAAGLPVVASAVGGLREVVEDGRTGWLVPPSDPAALAERLRILLIDHRRRRAMGAAGLARVREHFSMGRMIADISQIYDDVLKPRE
jgi:glycosyltransferase involved in cell wall biosynthesis